MKRKLVKQGAATMMISLPSKWVKENKLEKGSEVDVVEEGKTIRILVNYDYSEIKKEAINVVGLNSLVNRIIMAEYIKGVDELEVVFSDKAILKKLQKDILGELLGFEIVKQTNNSILIKDITGTERRKINEFIERLFLIIDSMNDELVIALEKKQDLSPVIEIDQSINKFANYCLRILNKYGYEESSKTSQIYGIVSLLEEIGDLYKELAETIEKSKVTKIQIETINDLRTLLGLFKQALTSFNRELAIKIANKYESIKKYIGKNSEVDFYLSRINDEMIKINGHLLVVNRL